MWESLIIVSVILVYIFTRNKKKVSEEEKGKEIEEEKVEIVEEKEKEEIVETGKPDYRDYNISKNIYQKKYVNREGDSFPPLLTHLISLIFLSLFVYILFGNGRRGTSESQFDNFLETWWIEFGGSIFSVFLITILFYGMFFGVLKIFFEKIGLSWSDEWSDDTRKYERYEEDLEEWELNKNTGKKVYEPEPEPEPETEEEIVLRERNERQEKKRVLGERFRKRKKEIEREQELEKERKEKEFWFGLDGLETEKELNKVFEKLGYKSELTPIGGDEGLDHILDDEIVVQTKNQKRKTSRPDLQKFRGSMKNYEKGIFVSINGFTHTCEKFVQTSDRQIKLFDVDDVIGMSEGKKPEWNE